MKCTSIFFMGKEGRQLFYEDADKQVFISILRTCQNRGDFELMGYCLMSSSIQLLILSKEPEMKSLSRLLFSYRHYLNRKYFDRSYVYDKHFQKINIENVRQYKEILMQIHQKPCLEGVVLKPEYYPYTSMNEYLLVYRGGTTWLYTTWTLKYMPSLVDFKIACERKSDDMAIH